MEELNKKGIQLFAVSPQTRVNNRELVEKHQLKFEILHDVENAFAMKLDLVHGFEPDLKHVYLQLGANLEEVNGEASWTLAIPARIAVGMDHEILSIQYDADYKKRPEAEDVWGMLP